MCLNGGLWSTLIGRGRWGCLRMEHQYFPLPWNHPEYGAPLPLHWCVSWPWPHSLPAVSTWNTTPSCQPDIFLLNGHLLQSYFSPPISPSSCFPELTKTSTGYKQFKWNSEFGGSWTNRWVIGKQPYIWLFKLKFHTTFGIYNLMRTTQLLKNDHGDRNNHNFHKWGKRTFTIQGRYSCEYTACSGSLSLSSPGWLSCPPGPCFPLVPQFLSPGCRC